MLGLTHPAERQRWFGFSVGGHFFRLVDGDRYLAVLSDSQSVRLVDAIRFEGNDSDPRRDIERLATEWAYRRGLVRRAPEAQTDMAGRSAAVTTGRIRLVHESGPTREGARQP
jgi:hypothetical protein